MRFFCWFMALAMVGCRRSPPPPAAQAQATPSADLTPAPPPSRCDAPADGATIALGEDRTTDEADSLPFAVEVGQAVAYDEGFALGALMPDPRGARASVVTIGPSGGSSRVVPLLTAHGDTPPPRVAAAGKAILAGVLESGPNNRRLKLARVEQGNVSWGPELEQSRDESLAFDVVMGASRALVLWDDMIKDMDHGVIKVASFDPKEIARTSPPRIVSPKTSDAEMPRAVPRPGGFWLVWVARQPEKTDDAHREVGESPEFRWLEALPLDEQGAPTGPARRLTPEKGHVLTYDILATDGGRAVILYRDDDTPSGSSGGILLKVTLRPDGASEPVVVADRHLGVGAPALLPGWIAMADAREETRLARLDPAGELLDRLESEPVLGRGEALAAKGDALLVVRPRGLGVRLFVTRCHNQAPPPPAASSGP